MNLLADWQARLVGGGPDYCVMCWAGTYVCSYEDKYVGAFRNGKRHGQGVYVRDRGDEREMERERVGGGVGERRGGAGERERESCCAGMC
jgi:hypothetical protein